MSRPEKPIMRPARVVRAACCFVAVLILGGPFPLSAAVGGVQERVERYGLLISFSSVCCGINSGAREKLDGFVSDYEKRKGERLKKETVYWGKEGEIDYCFKLSELSAKEKRTFVAAVRALLKDAELVRIVENARCANRQKARSQAFFQQR